MYYDILEGPMPAGWDDIKVVWFDANQCGTSEVFPPKQSGSFMVTTRTWKPNFEGKLLGVGGHIHDGGVDVQVNYAPGKQLCNSVAAYAESKEYVTQNMAGMGAGGHGGHADGLAKNHISSMTACYIPKLPITRLSKDQSWQVVAHYDYDKFAGNKENGKQSEIMAIALMYVAIPASGVRLEGAAPPAPPPAAPAAPGGGAPAAAPMQSAGQPAGLPPAKGPGKGGKAGRPAPRTPSFMLDDTLRWVEAEDIQE
jgi:hypothetical protein